MFTQRKMDIASSSASIAFWRTLWIIVSVSSFVIPGGHGFTTNPLSSSSPPHRILTPNVILKESLKVIDFCDFGEDDLQVAGVAIEDLSWRVHKLRLEEENKRRFLKAKPRFLPYNECRKWVQAFGRWKSETEWKEWIADGEKRNSYIPSRPNEYYSNTGDWVSWDHFLGTQSSSPSDSNKE